MSNFEMLSFSVVFTVLFRISEGKRHGRSIPQSLLKTRLLSTCSKQLGRSIIAFSNVMICYLTFNEN